ncbi:MAG: winged helix-turn-helix domain-containing protein, partial [Desulfotignum sp.]|nr:winged helix-turn-helix domain-containing protein [Desulfotignum sp.]
HYFTGMPVEDLLEELEEKQLAAQVKQMADMDSVDFFVREMCELDSTSLVPKDELFDQYQAFCETHGHPPFNRPVFFKRLYRACRNMTLKHLRRRDPGGEKDARTYCVAGIRVVA